MYPDFRGGDSIGQVDPEKGIEVKALKRVSFFVPENRYGGRHCGTYLGGGNPDFVALCGAYGIPARLAASNAEAERYAAEMLAAKGPFVLVCRTDPDTPTV